MAGKRIGAYRILREIGHGGMAVVYLAERADDQYRKRRRHQNAATRERTKMKSSAVFATSGRPWRPSTTPASCGCWTVGAPKKACPISIMEYVEGVRIDEYCDTHKLSITERLQLFRAVCLAVQYAHDTWSSIAI